MLPTKRWFLGMMVTACLLPGLARAYDAVKPEEVSAGDPYNIKEEALMDPTFLKGIKIAMVCAHGFEEVEATYPLKYLRERSATVDVVCPDWIKGRVMAVQFLKPSIWIPVTKNISDAKVEDYDAVVIPGGAWNPIIMRTDGKILDFVKAAHQKGKLVASVCHGPQVLITAGLVKGRDITGVGDIRMDLRNAGGTVHEDKPLVQSGNLLTSRDPHDLLEFSKGISLYLHDTVRQKRFKQLHGE
jgi:protease I